MTESEFVRHMPCENCGSSDANSLYSDGHTFCFVCHHRTGDNDVIHSQTMTQTVTLTGSAERLNKRNISEKTNQFYQIYRDGNTLRFPYHDDSGILKGVKIKTKKKDFIYEGVSTNTLFGQHRFPSTGKRIVVTEGELDAASCYEAMAGWPMVSLPHGAASAKKDIQKQIPLFQGYEETNSSLMEMRLAGRQQKMLQEYYHLGRSRSLDWRATRMRQRHYKPMIMKPFAKLSGMRNRIGQMVSSMGKLFLKL